MKPSKIYKNSKFPNKLIEIFVEPVYGGGKIVQCENGKYTQSVVLAKKAFNVFINEIEKEGWNP